MNAGIPLIRVIGDPFEAGYRHGAARATALREFLDDDLCRLNRILPAPVSVDSLRPTVGDAHVQREWRRIWRGYAAYASFVEHALRKMLAADPLADIVI
jgi:hypothetical protein